MHGSDSHAKEQGSGGSKRLQVLRLLFGAMAAVIVVRLFMVQVYSHGFYEALASDARGVFERLVPVRGEILLRDRDGSLYPVAANRDTFTVFVEPRNVEDPEAVAAALAPIIGMPEEEILPKLAGTNLYAPVMKGVEETVAEAVRSLGKERGWRFLGLLREPSRSYPEPGMGGHVLGFVSPDSAGERRGQYGLEGYWDKELAGAHGFLAAEKDVVGRWIPVADRTFIAASDGADLVLTIDRAIQFFACKEIKESVERHGASGGSAVILDPKTGSVLAMCGAPDFDPNDYSGAEDLAVFNNPAIYSQYEPGSVMKTLTMAAAVDLGKVGPKTTYDDEGEFKIGGYTIRNSDGEAHGVQTMTEVLEKSLNTGAIFAQRSIGVEAFREYVKKFGFGQPTGIELSTESPGNLSSLDRRGEIFAATASYGQGITATPIQLAAAYGALANGGVLMRPHIIAEIHRADGTEVREPERVREVVSARTAALLGGMLVNVVENGHGKSARVPGYWIAGKTGTAQVARADAQGYEQQRTIGTFAGYGPVEDPRCVMVVRIDDPKDVQFAESTAAPAFGHIAAFVLNYLHVPTTR